VLCTNGHNNVDSASFCSVCGLNTFAPAVVVVTGKSSAATNGLAIASMVLGIVWIYGITSVLALVFGYMAKKQIADSGQRGSGMATAGIVLGWIGVCGAIFIIVFFVAFVHSVHFVPNPQFNQP
jgi:hypothetical protein